MKTVEQQVYEMLLQDVGKSLADSGGYPSYDENGNYTGSTSGYGRHFERHKNRTLESFKNEKEVTFNVGWGYGISVFHYLTKQLDLDDLCREFNELECEAFDSINGYGLSREQEEWLNNKGYELLESYNTCMRDTNLSQAIQYTLVKEKGSLNDSADYLLIQTHNGCDQRDGYSDAKLFVPEFMLQNYGGGGLAPEDVSGVIHRNNLTIPISNTYDGYWLRIDGEIDVKEDPNQLKLFSVDDLERINPIEYKIDTEIEPTADDIVELYLSLC